MNNSTTAPSQPKKMLRPIQGRKVAGVCAAIALYVDVDPTLVRVLAAVLGICTGVVPGILVYLALMFIIPVDQG